MCNPPLLSRLPVQWKVLVTFFLLSVGCGYLFTTIQVILRVGTTYSNIVYHYSAHPQKETDTDKKKSPLTENNEEFDPFSMDVAEPITAQKLVHNRHIHIIVQSILFFLLSVLLLMTTLPEKITIPLIAMPFIAILSETAGMFLTRYLADQFAIVILFSGSIMGLSFALIFVLSLYELWMKKTG